MTKYAVDLKPYLSLQKCIDIVRATEVAIKQMHNIKEEQMLCII